MNSSQSGSRPFLNMINPMGRTHHGYIQANQSLIEEDENTLSDTQRDLEAGTSKSKHRPRVSWDAGASEMNVLRNNASPPSHNDRHDSSDDDEVPQSFMIETAAPTSSRKPSTHSKGKSKDTGRSQPLYSVTGRTLPPVLPTHSSSRDASAPPRPSELADDRRNAQPSLSSADHPHERPYRASYSNGLSPHERALWNWVNVYNLDAFLQEVYYYYEGKGIYSIALARGLNLLTVGFVIGFSTFLLGCVEYHRIDPDKVTRLSDIIVPHCVSRFSGFTLLFFILFIAFYIWQIFTFAYGIMRLVDMYNFYTHLLKIPNEDIQTISWPEIVRRLANIRQDNPFIANSSSPLYSAKLDAHDVANRIMRQENYLIALFNKELLDLRVPLPAFVERFTGPISKEGGDGKQKGQTLTKALEWNLRFCLMQYLFDHEGKVMKVFLKRKNRDRLIEGLQRRFVFMGCLNAIFAPFIVPYLLVYSFFRYFEEYHKNPSLIGGRRYTAFAQWKFREFNELPHLFTRRLDESYPLANIYIGQFPNENMAIIMRFVAFIAGSFAAVLALASMLDTDVFTHLEITPHRNVLFYLTIFTSILAVARGMIPEENRVFDPELLMEEVITHTHYMPDQWKESLHSKQVHQEFGELFQMRILTFVQELLSVLLTPFVLWFSLPACAPAIIDFFRDFSVHVEGRGYVCSFAEFNFDRHGNVKFGAPVTTTDKRMISNEGKMEKSFLNFKAANPDWTPNDVTGSVYLSRMANLHTHLGQSHLLSPTRRRQLRGEGSGSRLDGTVQFNPPAAPALGASIRVEDKAQAYDRALLQSQHAALRRRGGTSVMGLGGAGATMTASSVFGGPAMAQTAVLGDSQGSVALAPQTTTTTNAAGLSSPPLVAVDNDPSAGIKQEDIALDGGVDSRLGDSYVDGGNTAGGNAKGGGAGAGPSASREMMDQEDEEIRDGGVLSLLAQIYGAGVGNLNVPQRRPGGGVL